VRFESLFRVLFVIYCLEAGIFLTLSPWTDGWGRLALLVPFGPARDAFLHPALRGLLSGFGIVHLIWAVHDVDLFVRRRPHRESDSLPLRDQ